MSKFFLIKQKLVAFNDCWLCVRLLNLIIFFLGDTLFLGGCGRFFEGTAIQMYEALIKILSQLPDSTVRK